MPRPRLFKISAGRAHQHLPFAAISLSVLPFPKNDMVESVGKRLNRARLERHISVEEAAHATKMRAERVLDLENDDYTNFPSLAYAKGFLVIYAKYLGVDVSDFSGNLNVTGRFGIEDYEYLHNAPERPPPITTRRKEKRSVKPLVLVILVLVILAIIGTLAVMNFVMKYERIGNIDQLVQKETPAPSAPTPRPQGPAFAGTDHPAVSAVQQPSPTATPVPIPVPSAVKEEDKTLVDDSVEIRRAEPVNPVPPIAKQPTPAPTAAATAAPTVAPSIAPPSQRVNEIELRPVKKTWVKISSAAGDQTPIFEDWLYPDAPPLKFRGGIFWIELGDKDGVQIFRNGGPVPYQAPGVDVE
jgi:cytoskeletal protein RodZ